jgi:hypothetical protein
MTSTDPPPAPLTEKRTGLPDQRDLWRAEELINHTFPARSSSARTTDD